MPNFQVDPALFGADAIDQIRLTARDASSAAVMGSTDVTVDPAASEWVLSLEIDLGDAETLQVIVEAELLSGGTIAWSGRLGPFTVPSSVPARALDVFPR